MCEAGEDGRWGLRASGLVAVGLLVLVVVASAAVWAVRPHDAPSPAAPRPAVATTHPAADALLLEHLPHGPLPPVDYLERGRVYHRSDGTTTSVPHPHSLEHVGADVLMGAGGLVTLHSHANRRTGAVTDTMQVGDRPEIPVMTSTLLEDYRQLAPGPHGTVYTSGRPGEIVVVGRHGRVSRMSTDGRRNIGATASAWWGSRHGRIWRLDAAHPGAGWVAMGPGHDPQPVYASDAVWVTRRSCGSLHDARTWQVLWRSCSKNPVGVDGASSQDGTYAVTQSSDRRLEVVEERTGRRVLTIDAGPGRGAYPVSATPWSGDVLLLVIAEHPNGADTAVGHAACDVVERRCWQVGLPAGASWIGPPTGN